MSSRYAAILAGILLSITGAHSATADELIVTGVADGPLAGGTPKAIELYVIDDIDDLSAYGVSSANNGTGSTGGPEFTFPDAINVPAGTFIYVATETENFNAFFGFDPDYTSSAASINGDDAIEVYKNGAVVDVFGDVDMDGTGEPWDYRDGWAYRVDGTGPDGSVFVLDHWAFSGIDVFDGEDTNDSSPSPFPIGSYEPGAEGDCNNNGVPDETDISEGTSDDCNGDGVPDECQLLANDCNDNDIPDDCDIDPADPDGDGEVSEDCNGDGIPDECQLEGNDCNSNGVIDSCDIDGGFSNDINDDGVPDECQITGIVINEIYADPHFEEGDANLDGSVHFSDDEFVEIYNSSGAPIDLSGFMLVDSLAVRHEFPGGTIVPDQCGIVVFGGGCPGQANFPGMVIQTASEGQLNLNNLGEVYMLVDSGGTLVDMVVYGPEGGEDVSLTRSPDITGVFQKHNAAFGTRFSPGTLGDGTSFVGCDDTPIPDDDFDGIPNEIDNCELFNPCQADCTKSGTADACEIDAGIVNDCNANGIPDICEVFDDCNNNGIPDECDIDPTDPDGDFFVSSDCNFNGVPDECDVDCNFNFVADECEIEDNPSLDQNDNGLIDSCEITPPAGVQINEIRISQAGVDNDEYIEITGPPGTPLSGLSYVVIGDAAGSGAGGGIEEIIDLTGFFIPFDGIFLIAELTFGDLNPSPGAINMLADLNFEDGANVTHTLVANRSGSVAVNVDIDADDDGVIDAGGENPLWWTHVVDAVGFTNGSAANGLLYAVDNGGANVGPDDIFIPAQVYRCLNNNDQWAIGPFDPFSTERAAADTPGMVNIECEIIKEPCDGDANGDDVVNVSDLLAVINNWGTAGPDGDVTFDGTVNVADLLLVINNWGVNCNEERGWGDDRPADSRSGRRGR